LCKGGSAKRWGIDGRKLHFCRIFSYMQDCSLVNPSVTALPCHLPLHKGGFWGANHPLTLFPETSAKITVFRQTKSGPSLAGKTAFHVNYCSSASAFASAIAFSCAAGGQNSHQRCSADGNPIRFHFLGRSKSALRKFSAPLRIYGGTRRRTRIAPNKSGPSLAGKTAFHVNYCSSASAFASAIAFSCAAGGQSS